MQQNNKINVKNDMINLKSTVEENNIEVVLTKEDYNSMNKNMTTRYKALYPKHRLTKKQVLTEFPEDMAKRSRNEIKRYIKRVYEIEVEVSDFGRGLAKCKILEEVDAKRKKIRDEKKEVKRLKDIEFSHIDDSILEEYSQIEELENGRYDLLLIRRKKAVVKPKRARTTQFHKLIHSELNGAIDIESRLCSVNFENLSKKP